MHEPPPECGGSSTAHGRERQTVLFVLSSSLEVYGLDGHATGASASQTRLRISPPPPSSADTRVQAHACVPGAAFRWARRARDSALTRRARHHDLLPYVPLKEDKAGKIVPTPNYLGILNFLHSLWLPPPLLTLMPVLPTLSACQSVEVTSSSLSGKTPPQHQCLTPRTQSIPEERINDESGKIPPTPRSFPSSPACQLPRGSLMWTLPETTGFVTSTELTRDLEAPHFAIGPSLPLN